MARRPLTGVLLVGGASERFGSPKALARFEGETLAERAWRTLGDACDERFVFGKAGEVALPFEVLDDGSDVRAPIAGVVAGVRAATYDVCVFLPVDCPNVTPDALRTLGSACRDAAVTRDGPLPGAWAKSSLAVLERRLHEGRLSLLRAYEELDVSFVDIAPGLMADADTPDELARLGR